MHGAHKRSAAHELGHAIVLEALYPERLTSIVVRQNGSGHITFMEGVQRLEYTAVMLAAGPAGEYLITNRVLPERNRSDEVSVAKLVSEIGAQEALKRLHASINHYAVAAQPLVPADTEQREYVNMATEIALSYLTANHHVLERWPVLVPRAGRQRRVVRGDELKRLMSGVVSSF